MLSILANVAEKACFTEYQFQNSLPGVGVKKFGVEL